MDSKYTGAQVEELLGKIKNLSKEDLEEMLTGNVTSHSHDTEIGEPECDLLSIATLEEDIKNLVGDGSVSPLDGDGTEVNPYILDSALKWILFQAMILAMNSSETKIYYKLTVNCDLAGMEIPVSTSSVAEKTKIQYSLDGDGHFIRNFILTGENAIVAPFPVLGNFKNKDVTHLTSPYEKVDADIRNIGFKDAIYQLKCDNRLAEGSASVAGICGTALDTTGAAPGRNAIQNCYLDSVLLNVVNSYSYAGPVSRIWISPLCGANLMSRIKDCYAKKVRVNVENVDSSIIVYTPFSSVLWLSDYHFFENIYTEVQIESNLGVTQDAFPTDARIIFVNCLYNSNYTSSFIPAGVEAVSSDLIRTSGTATNLGAQFAWDKAKNDGYPYLVNQSGMTPIYDGYVRKSEIDKLLSGSSTETPPVAGVYKLPFELAQLTPESTSDEIRTVIGGLDAFHNAIQAIKNFSRIVIAAAMGSEFICCEAITKATVAEIQEDGTEMEGFMILMINGGGMDGFIVSYLKGTDAFVYQKIQ